MTMRDLLTPIVSDYFECPPLVPSSDTLQVGLPGGLSAQLPGAWWPDAAAAGPALPVTVVRVEKKVANDLIEQWGDHPLGPCNRLFGFEAYVLVAGGDPAALAIGCSTVSARMGQKLPGWHRFNVIELARLARAPHHEHAMRPMLRLWREYCAPLWPQTQPRWQELVGVVSYQLPGTKGHMYNHDGWKPMGEVKPSGGGGNHSNKPRVNDLGEKKKLWVWPYGRVAAGVTRAAVFAGT